MTPRTLPSLLAFKAWSSAELFARLAELAPEHAATLHTSLRTLNHIHVVDRLFRAYLSGEPRPFAATNTPEIPALDQLRDDVARNDAWYVQYAGTLSPDELSEPVQFTFTDGERATMSREEMLLHVITHSSYHRGNVGQLLKTLGLPPPRDLYTRFLHTTEPQRRA